MARALARQGPRLLPALLAAAFALSLLVAAGVAFLPAPAAQRPAPAGVGAAVAASVVLGTAAPALAEEEGGLLNFGKVPLGGGFALNLDIPETGIINIVVLIAGLIYLLAPLLSESMSTREKEIQSDIDDAIAKFNEATDRLAEAQKAKAQADEVVAEINASIEKDQADFAATIEAQTKVTLEKQAAAAEATLAQLKANAENKVEAYIQEEAVTRGLKELMTLSAEQKSKFMDAAIESL
eukprot:CAMPEP_0179039628 /NCGR_PEP_ID=MMETSP0796-20121207/15237_1 /TAXON_ID=73915 /ORGANISM="Pyrodinium bahamense, Strain pbaha01" /LENGTH=238 /DNA_ID=CAMNT_0020735963 /DNA_START=52 /DNA_END=768 /DNA_ORIENTATION=-